MARTIAALKRELAAIDSAMQVLLKAHASPALRSSKGMGPIFQATSLALLPELGTLTRQQIAKRVGVAPMNRGFGEERIFGMRDERQRPCAAPAGSQAGGLCGGGWRRAGTVVAMEACSGAHHWARRPLNPGHRAATFGPGGI